MRISHGTNLNNQSTTNGYGYATDRMLASLRELGHEVSKNDKDAAVQIWFDQPQHWKWNGRKKDQYRIGYHPWESTALKPGWLRKFNDCNELWTPSPLIAKWYRDVGVKRRIYVYQHGVDKVWKPKRRQPGEKLKFLHIGAEAARKGGFDVMKAFNNAFRGRDDVELTLKMVNPGWNIPSVGKVRVLDQAVPLDKLVELFHSHHVYVYPSWGEGFGLTPLQAMATGMPTITVPAWAPYSHYLDKRLNIPSKLVSSPWPNLHPGQMFQPDLDAMMEHMVWVADNYDEAHEFALAQTDPIAAEYDWTRLTDEAFTALQGRLNL